MRSTILLSALLVALWAGHCVYRRQADTKRLSVALGLITLLMASGAGAGAISQLGLALDLPLIDPSLAEADQALGLSSEAVIAWMIKWPFLPWLLGIAYVSSFPLLFITALALALRGDEDQAWELSFVFAAAVVLSACCAVLLPAEGAFAYYRIGPELTNLLPGGSGVYHLPAMEYFRNASVLTLDVLRLQGVVTFPSFHTALALMTMFAWRRLKWVFYPMVGWNSLVIVSTIPIGGHFGVDLIGGALLWVVLALSCERMGRTRQASEGRWWRGKRLMPQREPQRATL